MTPSRRAACARIGIRSMGGVAGTLFHHLLAVATGSYRRTVGANALIRDDAGRVLLVRTAYPRRRWGLPGGGVERGEAPSVAVVREVREETGIDVRVTRLLAVDVRKRRSISIVFACVAVGGELRAQPGEIATVAWLGPRSMHRLRPDLQAFLSASGTARAQDGAPLYLE